MAGVFLLWWEVRAVVVPGTFCRFCAWHHIPFLYLAPFPLFVPGTFSSFCTWLPFPLFVPGYLFPFLCLAPYPLFVPGTFSPFCAWHLSPFLCLAPYPLFVPGTFLPFCTWHHIAIWCQVQKFLLRSSHQTQKSSQPSGLAAFCIKHLISYSSAPLRT